MINQFSPINYTGMQLQGLPSLSNSQASAAGLVNVLQQRKARLAQEQQVEQQNQLKQQYSMDLQSAFDDGSPKAMAQLISKYPQQREAFKQSFDLLNEDQKNAEIGITTQVYSALQSGNNDAAKNILDKQIQAFKNDNKDSSKLERIRESIDINPKGVAGFAGLTLASLMGKEQFAKVSESLGQERRAEEAQPLNIKKLKADLGLTNAQANKAKSEVKKINAETGKINQEKEKLIYELEAAKDTATGLFKDPEKKFNIEKKVRDDYKKYTSGASEANRIFENITASADDNSGAGDVALITSFMKMLDPGSVVRETEFATARDTDGLLSTLRGLATKVQTGEFLNPQQRKKFKNLAAKYYKSFEKEAKKEKKNTEIIVKNYQLTPENIFGAEEEQQADTQAVPTPTNAITIDQAQNLGITFQ